MPPTNRKQRVASNQAKPPLVNPTLATTVRAGGQMGAGYAIAVLLRHAFGWDLDSETFGALVAAIGWAVAWLQNLAENAGVIPAILKRVPPKGVPLIDDAGNARTALLFAIAVLVLAVIFGFAVNHWFFLLIVLLVLCFVL